MQLVKGQTFGQEPLIIDDQMYYECVFRNTHLIYSGGNLPNFDKCKFYSITFGFQGAASNTLSFMRTLYHVGFKDMIKGTFDQIMSIAPPQDSIKGTRMEIRDGE